MKARLWALMWEERWILWREYTWLAFILIMFLIDRDVRIEVGAAGEVQMVFAIIAAVYSLPRAYGVAGQKDIAAGFPPRLFLLPMPTWQPVSYKLILRMLEIALGFALFTAVAIARVPVNSADWYFSCLHVALWVGAIAALAQAWVWALPDLPILGFLLAVGSMALCTLGLEAKSTYTDGTIDLWTQMGPYEVAALLAVLALAWAIALWGVARDRRGDARAMDALRACWEKVSFWRPRRYPPFRSAAAGLFHYEWHTRARMPILFLVIGVILIAVVVACFGPSLADRGFLRLYEVLGVIGPFAWWAYAAIQGAAMGAFSSREMALHDDWLLLRPLSSTQIANVKLKAGLLGLSLGGLFMALIMLLACLGCLSQGQGREMYDAWKDWPLTLADCFFIFLVGLEIYAFVGARLMAQRGSDAGWEWLVYYALGWCVFTGIFASNSPHWYHRLFGELFLASFGLGLLAASAWRFVRARQENLIGERLPCVAMGLWMFLSIVFIAEHLRLGRPLYLIPPVLGVIALGIASLAMAPLAIHSRRHR